MVTSRRTAAQRARFNHQRGNHRRQADLLDTHPKKKWGNTQRMSRETAIDYATRVRTVLEQNVVPEPGHTSSIILLSSSAEAAARERKHYEEKDDLFYKAKVREIGTLLLSCLFRVKHPHTATLGGIVPKTHFLGWLADSESLPVNVASNSKIFDMPTETSEQPPSQDPPVPAQANNNAPTAGPAAKVTIAELTDMLNSLSDLTGDANGTVHALTATQVIRVMNSPTTRTELGDEAYTTLKKLVEAIFGYALQHAPQHIAEGGKNFKKLIKDFHNRVATAPVLTNIEREWSVAFNTASKRSMATSLIDEGLVVSAEAHKVTTAEVEGLKSQVAMLMARMAQLEMKSVGQN